MKREASFIVIVWSIFYFLAVAPVALEGEANSEDKFFIEKRWSTGRIFKIPESIKFDSDRERIYVANINGRSNSKDGNGFISIISLEGEVVELKWIEGLNAPKGMGIYGGKLFVADIDEVVEIDIEDEKIVERYGAGGAQFLNDEI